LLKKGFGEWTPYFRQNADSIAAFQLYERIAKGLDQGMWKQPERVGSKIPRVTFGLDRVVWAVEFPININIADVHQLQALSGIGPAYAERIIDYRLENGPFRDVEELRNIRGIGPVTMERLRPYVTVE
jgi:competence ComEA-like helix-hairpin-helix protein